jgi:O-antigen/teichoic acid export membrane protein
MRLLASESEAILADGALGEMGRGTIWSLARSAVPLGADTGVVSLATNAPRFAVQAFMGSSALGVFAALAYFTQVVSLVTGALGDSVVGPLAKQAARRDAEEFGRLILKLATFAVVVSGASAVGAWVVGAWVLRLVLGGEYADRGLLVILMLGAGGITLQRSLGRGLQAAQRYSTLLLVDSLVLISTVVFALTLTPRFGLDGAAAALGLGYLVGVAVSIVVMRRIVTGMRADQVRVTH